MDTTDFKKLIAKAALGQRLTEAESADAFDAMLSGNATPSQMGGFLMALRVRGETVEEITGAARAMRAKALMVTAPANAIDTCGTGGDASGSFNISTATALVVAGAGVPVAKHGNRNLSSKCGSADVLAALGVNIEADPTVVQRAIADAKIGFLMAPRYHGAFRHVMPTRVELGTRTIFNLLGPLSNPAGAKRQLLGVFAQEWVRPLAEVLGKLGSERAWVVHGDGMDELTTTGTSVVAELKDGKVSSFEVKPEDLDLARASREAIAGGDPAENAARMRALLHGEKGPIRDIVLLNAGAALVVAGQARTHRDGVDLAAKSIDGGKAAGALARMVAITNEPPPLPPP
jgi:anthranilate phosphoribosyltransferase